MFIDYEMLCKLRALFLVIVINGTARIRTQIINNIVPYGLLQYPSISTGYCEERVWQDFTQGFITIQQYYDRIPSCKSEPPWFSNWRQQVPLIPTLQQQQTQRRPLYWQPLQHDFFFQRQPNLLFPHSKIFSRLPKEETARVRAVKPPVAIPSNKKISIKTKFAKTGSRHKDFKDKSKLIKHTDRSDSHMKQNLIARLSKQSPSRPHSISYTSSKLTRNTSKSVRRKEKPSKSIKTKESIKDKSDLTNALTSLLFTDGTHQMTKKPLYYGQSYIQPNLLYNSRPITPYYYVQYPLWSPLPITVNLHVNKKTESGGIYPTNDYDTRVRKAFISANSNPQANTDKDIKNIRSFLRKQKSDTSLFQEESIDKHKEVDDNEHALTLKDYENYISHPKNASFEVLDDLGEEESGSVRSLDNIIDGDDDDEIIEEATEIKAKQTAKLASSKDSSLDREHVLRKQTTLRKLEHDKLIERYARPPANPIEYLSQIFDELDTDTKVAEENQLDNDKENSFAGNSTGSLRVEDDKVETGKKKQEFSVSNIDQNELSSSYELKNSSDTSNTTSKEDEKLLNSVFDQLNPSHLKATNKSKRSPIENVDLEGWFHTPKYKTLLTGRSKVMENSDMELYPIGDIAEIAKKVNGKRNEIASTRVH